jgi:hypothetical protein
MLKECCVGEMVNRVLIVGGGLTGGLVRHFFSKDLTKYNLPNTIYDIWEIEPNFGGRMKSVQFQKDGERFDLDLVRQVLL